MAADTTGAAGATGTASGTDPASPRERYRAQVRAEVKERAWAQVAEAGASALSLNAIARQMGMSGPALYRYFAGRDELITALIRDAYRSLADAFHAAAHPAAGPATAPGEEGAAAGHGTEADNGPGAEADAGTDSGTAAAVRLARTMRRWALEDPQRYFLLFGTPVPGYHAPEDTTAIAVEVMGVMLDVCARLPPPAPDAPAATAFDAHLRDHRQWAGGHPAPPAALHRALSLWTRLHGLLSLELAGQFDGMAIDPELFYTAEVEDLLRR
ncbi:TetR/AcrR family transcriptional regulator [Actinacidiphila sp. DG2A-62]|uniref:TetR/AcrR family transcriptional regulator n=1 Tax=Actinacidiphila sp. DG2A-62 TaxID=3108821 RepID=UPI002DBE3DA0|nr:TetR/AcrR family transcriptional regulator [Actinacidiphila sp. DG2A-62]MEC3993896.1 TetR/AcrR family transcriptional regulator [Actinacidiphila sp. DG2A-62]